MGPPRIRFLRDALEHLAGDLAKRDQRLILRRGDPVEEIPRLIAESGAELLSFNRDPGPYAKLHDSRIRAVVEKAGARVLERKDRVVYESAEVRTKTGQPFRVYTPFRRAWMARLREEGTSATGPIRPRPATRVRRASASLRTWATDATTTWWRGSCARRRCGKRTPSCARSSGMNIGATRPASARIDGGMSWSE